MSSYVSDLEHRVELLEVALEASKKRFSVLKPDDMFILTKSFQMTDRFVLSFNRDLYKVLLRNKMCGNYTLTDGDADFDWHYTHDLEMVKFTIPKGTIFSIENYEVKRRRPKNKDYDFIKTKIVKWGICEEAKDMFFRMTPHEFNYIQAETYIPNNDCISAE